MTPRRELWERWAMGWRLLAGLAFLVVGFAVIGSVPAGWPPAPRFWILFAALAAWYGGSVVLGRDRLYGSFWLSLLYFAVGWALWAPLLELHPATYAFATFFFPLTYSHLPTGRAIGFALVATFLMYVHGTAWWFDWSPGVVLGGSLGVISAVMLALFIHSIIKQSEERRRLIQELEAARASLAQVERQAGVLEERQRLAQEIHDTVAQGFVGIVTHLEAAEASLSDPGSVAGHIAEAKGSARESLRSARRLVWDLRPDLLNGEPLTAVLERQLREWSARTGIPAEPVVTGTPRALDADREAALVQAVREALSNVRSHARANRVTLTLSYMEDEVALDVQDDGIGVTPVAEKAPEAGGFGLRALEERVRGLGGSCALESSSGQGATLTVTLPLPGGAG